MDGDRQSLADPVPPARPEPPYSIEAEQGLLGCLMMDNGRWDAVAGWLRAEHFANAGHAYLYGLIGGMIADGKVASPVTLKPYVLADDPAAALIREAGGLGYVARLAGAVATVVNVTDYARQIKDTWVRRRTLEVSETLAYEAGNARVDDSGLEVAGRGVAALDALAEDGTDRKGPQRMHDVALAVLGQAQAAARGEVAVAVDTGLDDLDRRLGGGLFPGDLIIVGGRPSMGKTSLCENIAASVARRFVPAAVAEGTRGPPPRREGGRVAFFSLEMSAEALTSRQLVRMTEIPGLGTPALRTGRLWGPDGPGPIPAQAWARMAEAAMETADWPLHVVDDVYDLRGMAAELRKMKRRGGVDLVIVDYLQIMDLPESGDSLTARLGQVTRGFKQLAKRLDVPVILLSQLSRQVEGRDNKRPQLADLRESGAIEQDADVVLFLYREQYYLERQEPAQKAEEADDKFADRLCQWQARLERAHNVAEVGIPKQRMGPVGSVKLWFDPTSGRFAGLAHDQGDEA